MTIIFIGILCWLLFGYIAYLKEARDLHTITFDGLELITCLFFGLIAFVIIMIPWHKMKNPFVVFVEWTMRLVQKKEKK